LESPILSRVVHNSGKIIERRLWSAGGGAMDGDRWEALDRQLAAHTSADAKEMRDVALVRSFLAAHPHDAHLRSQLAGHLTGSGFVLDSARARLLLLHHVRLDRWLQPGGHGEGELAPRAIALREIEEETGLRPEDLSPFPDDGILDVDVHAIPANPKTGEPAHVHLDLRYGFVARAGAQARVSEESHALRWVPFDELLAMEGTDESVRRAASKLRTLLGR
jgi:8-oxo-dGTP pyrophosphatase MutT (NUDIX family)